MLVFIGLGLHDEKDITLKGLEEARSCDELYAEFYTSILRGTTLEEISASVGKDVKLLDRKDLEENADNTILKGARSKKVGLLVAGDPLISTTHVQVRLRAKEFGIETRVVHNASIYSASASISGLQNYKFGKSASIPFPEEGYIPETPYDVINENTARGLHTLLFLDIKVEGGYRLMTANEAIDILLNVEEKRGEGVFTEETL
ncbi:MAG: diphthine synthase, partial [Candidatus Hydrothermarchaeales archaeon]